MLLKGNVGAAMAFNPNVFWCAAFLVLYPIMALYDAMTKRAWTHSVYRYLEQLLHKRIVLTAVLIFELLVWIHNIMEGI